MGETSVFQKGQGNCTTFKLSCTLKLPGEFLKILMPGLTPRDFDLIGVGCSVGVKTFQYSPGDSNVRSRLSHLGNGHGFSLSTCWKVLGGSYRLQEPHSIR